MYLERMVMEHLIFFRDLLSPLFAHISSMAFCEGELMWGSSAVLFETIVACVHTLKGN